MGFLTLCVNVINTGVDLCGPISKLAIDFFISVVGGENVIYVIYLRLLM